MENWNTNDLHGLIVAKDETFPMTYSYLHNHLTTIASDRENSLKIKSIIENSKQWKEDLALWCLIDNCEDQCITHLHMNKLQNKLNNICGIQHKYNKVDIVNQLIFQQACHPELCSIRQVIELLTYLQSGFRTLPLLCTRYEDPAWTFTLILNKSKVLWMTEFIPASKDNRVMAELNKNLDHPKHFRRCNIDIVQDFLLSIPQPYEINHLIKLFDYFTDGINLLDIGILESFLSEHTGTPLETCIAQLCISISLQHVRKNLNGVVVPANILSNVRYCIQKMLLLSWSLNEVCDMLSAVQNATDLTPMNSVLTIITDYRLIYDRTIFNFIQRSCPASQWLQTVHEHALRMSFSADSQQLQLNELIDEIIQETYPNAQQASTKRQQLSHNYAQFLISFNRFSSMDRKALKDQLVCIRTNELYSQVAFVIRASDLLLGHKMRIVQQLGILLALDPSSTTARILQINTGEGKTRIIAVLAAIKCLQGKKVDVITSSKELAKIQAVELNDFYKFFDFKVACNADMPPINYTYGRRRRNGDLSASIFFSALGAFQPVYECDVIYGSANDFEADILRDEFTKSGVRCGRRCEFALVDEVDNMLIDGRQHILHLSSSIPSVFHLLPIKAIIWNQILNVAKMVVKRDDGWYKLCDDEEGNEVPELLNESIQEFSQRLILPLLKNHIHLDETTPDPSKMKLIIPKHLHAFTSMKLRRWIRNAAYAKFEMKEGREYMLKDKKIIFVDVNNTGVLHDNMRWSDGLHCFLEMKHGCSLEPEHITTNFISHITFFCRYSTNLIGLTGTVGGEATRHVFREVYSSDCLIIPPFSQRRHHELQPRFTSNEVDWYLCIVNSCEEKMRLKRAVLIITKYIEQARHIADLLRSSFHYQVKLYTENEEKQAARESLNAGYALVATNIAGRGTDLLVSTEVEENGGLHVCVTFLPDNDRVERQNQGRTSRCGNKGTSQFIINLPDFSEHIANEDQLLKSMREQRNQCELTQMQSAIEDVKATIQKDQLFQQFSNAQDEIIACFPTNVREIAGNALREKFGFWLIESNSEKDRALQQSFADFLSICRRDTRNSLIDNPIYYVQMANSLLKEHKDLDDAIQYLTIAIQMDPHCAASAYFSRGYARVLQYKRNREVHRLDDSISNFEQARRIIKDILDPALMLFPVASNKSPLHEYIIHLKTLYATLTNSINAAIGRPVGEEIAHLHKQLESTEIDENERKELREHLQQLENNRSQIEDGILRNIARNKTEIKVQHKALRESLPDSEKKDLYKKEIGEMELNGFMGTIIFNERKPIDWWSVISVGAIGLGQMITGVSLAVFSFGAGIGFGLSVLQEGISDLITCVKDGIINRNFSWKQWGIQKAVSLAVTIACAGFSAFKAAARTVRSGLRTAKNAVQYGMKELWTKAVKEGFQIGGKKVALEVVKRVAIEMTLPLVNYALAQTVVPIVENLIQTALSNLIVLGYKNNGNLQRLMNCDRKQRNQFFANKLKQNVLAHLREGTFELLCKTAGRILLIKASSSIGEAATKILSVSLALSPIITKLGSIMDSFGKEIDKLAQLKEVQDILNATNSRNLVTTDERQAENEEIPLTVEEFCSGITEQMSKIICQLIQGMLVPPLIASEVDHCFSDFNHHINTQLNLFHRKQSAAYSQSLIQEEIKAKVNPETRVSAQQEMDAVRKGAPGRIHHIGFICQAKNIRVRMYDEEGRVEHVIGDDTSKDAIDIVYHPPSEPDGIGHWTIKDGENTQNTGRFNCLFDAMGEQIGCTGEQLRQDTAAAMESNQDRLAATMYDVQYLEKNCSEALFTGGVQRRKEQRHKMREEALKATFGQKHLIAEKSKHGRVTMKDVEEKTTKILDKELNKMELDSTKSVRTTNTVLLMTPEKFQVAIAKARENNQFTPSKPGEIKVKLTNVEMIHMTWHMDENKLPTRTRTGEIRYKNQATIIGDVEVIFNLATNAPVHLDVVGNSASTASQSFLQKP